MNLSEYISNEVKTAVFESSGRINEGLGDIFKSFFGEFSFTDSFSKWKDDMKAKREAQILIKEKAAERKKKLKEAAQNMKDNMKKALQSLKDKQADAMVEAQIRTMKARLAEFQARTKSIENIIGKANPLDSTVSANILSNLQKQIDGLPEGERDAAEKMQEKVMMFRYKLNDEGKPEDVGKAAMELYTSNKDSDDLQNILKDKLGLDDAESDKLAEKMNEINRLELSGDNVNEQRDELMRQAVAESACMSNFKKNYSKAHSEEETESALADMEKRSQRYTSQLAKENDTVQKFLQGEEESQIEVRKAIADSADAIKEQGEKYIKARDDREKLNAIINKYYGDQGGTEIIPQDGGSAEEAEKKLEQELSDLGLSLNDDGTSIIDQINNSDNGFKKQLDSAFDEAQKSMEETFPKDDDGNTTFPEGLAENNDFTNLKKEDLEKYAEAKRKEYEEAKDRAENTDFERDEIIKTLKTATDPKKPVSEKDLEKLAKEHDVKSDDTSWMTDKQKEEWEALNDKYKNGDKPEEYAEKSSEMKKKFREELGKEGEPKKPDYTIKVDNSGDTPKYYKVDKDGHETELTGDKLRDAVKEQVEYNTKKKAYDQGKSEKSESNEKTQAGLKNELKKEQDKIKEKYPKDSTLDPKQSVFKFKTSNDEDAKELSVPLFDKNGKQREEKDIRADLEKQLKSEGMSDDDIKSKIDGDDGLLKGATDQAGKDAEKVKAFKEMNQKLDDLQDEYDDKIAALDDGDYDVRASDDEMESDIDSVDDSDLDDADHEKDETENGTENGKPKEPAKWTKRTNSKSGVTSYFDQNGNRVGSIRSKKVRAHLAAVKRYRKRLAEWKKEHPNESSLLDFSKRMLGLA